MNVSHNVVDEAYGREAGTVDTVPRPTRTPEPEMQLLDAVAAAASVSLGGAPVAFIGAAVGTVVVGDWAGAPPTRVEDLHVRVPVNSSSAVIGWLGATPAAGRALPPDARGRLLAVATVAGAALGAPEGRSDGCVRTSTSASGARAHDEVQQLVEEQRALREVGDLVARGRPPREIFTAVAAAASTLLGGIAVTLTRFDGHRDLVVEALSSSTAPPGRRLRFEPDTLPDRVRITGRPSRIDDYRLEHDAELAVKFGLVAAVAVPIVLSNEVWGQLTATAREPLPRDTEHRLQQFAELVATPLANLQARWEIKALVDEHAALRRVAELVTRDTSGDEILEAISREAAQLSGVACATVLRFLPDGASEIVVLTGWPLGVAVEMQAPAGGDGAVPQVWRTGQPARNDGLKRNSDRWPRFAARAGFGSSAAAPIHIAGVLWGVLVAVAREQRLPTGTESRLANFTELAGTVIAAAQARGELRTMADEQAALRRVAELVAHGAALDDVFIAVAAEASTLVANRGATLTRYIDDHTSVVVAACDSPVPVGLRVPTSVDTAIGQIFRTGLAVRLDTYEGTDMEKTAKSLDIAATVTIPVIVEGRVWGTLGTASSDLPPPSGTEERLDHFAQLAAAAIANAENKTKLTASRARVVAAADETRRRLQRDVHDTAQQRLVHTIVTLQLAATALGTTHEARPLVDEALRNAQHANRDIRDIVRGILPAALTRGGLAAGVRSLVYDLPLKLTVDINVPRLGPAVETTAYFVVAEALTNIAKHADADHAHVNATMTAEGSLAVTIRDNGRGGALANRGTGLTGLVDRVEASDGTFTLDSPPGAGTTVHIELPVGRAGPNPPYTSRLHS